MYVQDGMTCINVGLTAYQLCEDWVDCCCWSYPVQALWSGQVVQKGVYFVW